MNVYDALDPRLQMKPPDENIGDTESTPTQPERERAECRFSERRHRSRSMTLREQEIPLDSPSLITCFQPDEGKPFVATPAALEAFRHRDDHPLPWSSSR